MCGRARRGVLDACERLVDGECVGDVSRALGPDRIAGEPANESNGCSHGNDTGMSRMDASKAADVLCRTSVRESAGNALELAKRAVDL